MKRPSVLSKDKQSLVLSSVGKDFPVYPVVFFFRYVVQAQKDIYTMESLILAQDER